MLDRFNYRFTNTFTDFGTCFKHLFYILFHDKNIFTKFVMDNLFEVILYLTENLEVLIKLVILMKDNILIIFVK